MALEVPLNISFPNPKWEYILKQNMSIYAFQSEMIGMREIFLFSIFYKRDKSIFSYFAFLYSYLVYLLSVNPTF